MKIRELSFLTDLKCKGSFTIYKNSNYTEVMVNANIPYKPGVYLVYSLLKNANDDKFLYYGKAGVTNNYNNP